MLLARACNFKTNLVYRPGCQVAVQQPAGLVQELDDYEAVHRFIIAFGEDCLVGGHLGRVILQAGTTRIRYLRSGPLLSGTRVFLLTNAGQQSGCCRRLQRIPMMSSLSKLWRIGQNLLLQMLDIEE